MSAGGVFEQAAGLAVVAAFYPPALLIAALYLGSERPGRTAVFYVLGGLVTVTIVGIIALIAIRAGGLSHLGKHQTRYGLRLGLGVVAIIAAAVIFLRKRNPKPKDAARRGEAGEPVVAAKPGDAVKPGDAGRPGQAAKPEDTGKATKQKKPSVIERLTARPTPLTAFAVGVVMFGPSVTFIAAVEVVATAKAGVGETIGVMVMIVVLAVAFAWLPLVAYVIAPERTIRTLRAFDAWLRRHGKTVLTAAVGVVGVLLVIQGITGLI